MSPLLVACIKTNMKEKGKQKTYWWRKNGQEKISCQRMLQPGETCPQCQNGRLAYNGLFMLTCTSCGHIAESGAFT